MGPTKRGKGSKLMAVVDGHGLPIAIDVASASPAEVRLVTSTLDARFIPDLPERLIGDKAYDSDPLAAGLERMDRCGDGHGDLHPKTKSPGSPPGLRSHMRRSLSAQRFLNDFMTRPAARGPWKVLVQEQQAHPAAMNMNV